jgi:glyoxylase-like metal-dependent hydrolase (beta-lactamase superfamily II)
MPVVIGPIGHAGAATAGRDEVPRAPLFIEQKAVPVTDKDIPGFYHYAIGDAQVMPISDGAMTMALPDGLVKNAGRDEINAALRAAFLPENKLTIHFTPVVIRTGGKTVLIDTGNGAGAFAASKGAVGRFATNLTAAGLDAGAIDYVVISHFHGDHVNGLLAADGTPVFPNAEVLVPAPEWAFWMDDGAMSRADGRAKENFANCRRVFTTGLNGNVRKYAWDEEVAPGLRAVAAPGHTPGHTAFTLSSGSLSLFIQSDVTNNPALFATHPGWHLMFDADPVQAEQTRRKVYDMLAHERMRVQGFHYPFPANGFVEKTGDGYRVVPAPWLGEV